MKIIMRYARDEIHALKIVQAMENSGVNVFSITHKSMVNHKPGTVVATSVYIIFAKYDNNVDENLIDELILKHVQEID